jgi:site-specific recombinase XerD
MTPAEIFCDMQSSKNTKRAYRNDIKKWEQFLAANDGAEIPETALAFKNALESIYAPSTAQRVWCTVAAFYGWMKGTGRIAATPFHGIKSPTRPSGEAPPVPSDTDVAKLLRACEDGTVYGQRSLLIITLLLNGLRAEEVTNARLKDIKRDGINKQWILNVLGKGEKWRAVPLTSDAQQAIFEYYLNNDALGEYLVHGLKAGSKIDTKAIWRAVSFYARKAGVEGIHPHALRHHYATRLVRAGVDVFTLQKLMGHARADTTQRYVGLDYSDLSKAVILDPMHNQEEEHKTLFFGMEEIEDNAPVPF